MSRATCCDIIMQVPWHCGDRDCPVGWHLASYWIDDSSETGYTVDNYTDGDHDLCEKDELPTFKEEQRAWLSYYRDVAVTGQDVLSQFFVGKPKRKERQRWTFWISRGIDGLHVQKGRRGKEGPWLPPQKLPKEVAKYMLLTDWDARDGDNWGSRIQWEEWKTLDDLERSLTTNTTEMRLTSRKGLRARVTGVIEVEVPRSRTTIEREVRRAARKAVRDLEKKPKKGGTA